MAKYIFYLNTSDKYNIEGGSTKLAGVRLIDLILVS